MNRSVNRNQPLTLSRRLNSRSTATRINSAWPSPSLSTASILASVPAGNLADAASSFMRFLPILTPKINASIY